jgi:non-ribosomal peptide synthetase component F
VRHKNFTGYIQSVIPVGTFSKKDTVLQMGRCTFDIHVQDVIGTLIVGATLVMLRPEGIMDLQYLAEVLRQKEITYMFIVPIVLNNLGNYFKENNLVAHIESLRSICSGG